MAHHEDIVIGTREKWGHQHPFSLTPEDRRQHLYVIGKTGTGKTTLLRNMIIQDIEAGRGVGIIDPHGDLAHDLLDFIPSRRTDDVVYFNPADDEFPIGFNLLKSADSPHLVASGIVGSLKAGWPGDSKKGRFMYIMHRKVVNMICPYCKSCCKKYGFFGRGDRCQRYRCNSCARTFSDIPYRPLGRLRTPLERLTRIVNLLVEGVGVRATGRLTKTNPNTVQSVVAVAGSKCAFFLDQVVREVHFQFVQVDEMFCFVGCKENNNVEEDPERGRQSIFLGVDADSRFIINWMIGKRTSCTIEKYMRDLKLRVARPFQLTTDGYELFEDEVKWAFYGEARYGQVTKKFIHPKARNSNTAEGRYEPSRVKSIYKREVLGPVYFDKISTSYIDRTHLNLRLFNRRLTRLTLGFSKKLECLKHSVALSIAHYNFCRVHHSLHGQTPAMAAGLADHIWSTADLLTESGQVGSEKWICPLREHTVSAPISDLKAA